MVSKRETAFEKITEIQDLVEYLKAKGRRRTVNEYLHHYTSLSTVISIFRYQTWHLSQASCMNDQLEYRNGDSAAWNNIFFSCFMGEDEESIGMWSMYGQPWERGVKLSIPKKDLVDWITSQDIEILEVNCRTKKNTDRIVDTQGQRPFLTAVAYCNSDRVLQENDKETLFCGRVTNSNFSRAANNRQLTGYIKDIAWAYEKEIRLRLDFDNTNGLKRVALRVPDSILDKIVLTPSPLFEGKLVDELQKEVNRSIIQKSSLFYNKFQLKSDCINCKLVQYSY